MKLIFEVEVPEGATHYQGNPLNVDDVVWFKQVELNGVVNWFFKFSSLYIVWFLSEESSPENLIKIGESDV